MILDDTNKLFTNTSNAQISQANRWNKKDSRIVPS